MPIILKNILKLISSYIMILVSFCAFCDEKAFVMQPEIVYRAIPITLEDNISKASYNISEGIYDNSELSNTPKVYATLSVEQKKLRVLAIIKFTNRGKKDYFIHRRLLPFRPDANDPYFFSPLCQNAFFISTEGVRLEFLPLATNICNYVEDDDNDALYIGRQNSCDIKSEWMKIASGKTIYFKVNLNDAYSFLPGEHWYRIVSLKYRIADDKWFLQRTINNLLFSIMDFHHLLCQKSNDGFYMQKLYDLCERDYAVQEKSIANFMGNFFPYGGKNKNYFDITSNQVFLKINGSEVKSYHDTKIELLKKRYKEKWRDYWF